ncbi:MAG TPA: hypothetical protein PLJ00_15530 [Chitinophagales bacterium]|nr:hypothetical protein [Chitinophagales bacterium]
MMNRCKIWMLIFGLLTVQAVQAQDDFIQRADKLYKNQIYDQAADMYLTYLQQTYNYEINLKLAECYRLMHSTVDAEYWYGVIVTQNAADPDILRRYADLLKTNGKYRSAKEYYLKYAAYEEDGYYYAASCDWAITNRSKAPAYFIDTLGFNTTDSELTPTFYKRGLIYARSTGNKINPTTGVSFYDLYYTELRNDSLWIISPMQNVNSEVHEAAPYYDGNDQKLYFTRNNHYRGRTIKSSDGEVKLELYFSTSVDNKFTGPRPLSVNSKTYSVGQPTVSPDGKVLIFASDKPGGYGGTDLYFCTKKGNDWSNAKNMGPAINSKGDELYPSMSPEGTLYFASNYHPGFGGFDIFKSVRVNQYWSNPENLGMPVNSSQDDYALIMRNGVGYFTSNRAGGQGSDDIYQVTQMATLSKIYVYDTDIKPIYKAKVTFIESPNMQVICETDASGLGDISTLSGNTMAIKISKEGFLDKIVYDLSSLRSSNGIIPVELQPLLGTNE